MFSICFLFVVLFVNFLLTLYYVYSAQYCLFERMAYTTLFSSLFSEAEPFAAILIAQGTHGRIQKFVFWV